MASSRMVPPKDNGEHSTTKVKKHKSDPEIPITVAISSDIFRGPVINFAKALKEVNEALTEKYPKSRELFEVLLISDNSPESLRSTISENDLDDLITVSEEDLTALLQQKKIHLFLSAERPKAEEALKMGTAAAVICPKKMEALPETQAETPLRIAFDGDAVLFSNESELVFKGGLNAFLRHEEEKAEEPMNKGPFKEFLEVLQKLQRKLDTKAIRTYLVTSRGAGCAGYRALKTLRSWGLETDEAVFLSGTKKGPTLKRIRPHIFFDDQESHIRAAFEAGTLAGHVPY
ncbi:cytosolic 5'-nucleotidase 1A-like isoform 1-T1 [Menidia menidia]